jgi:Family of unknown function (DUF6518)
MSATEIPAGPQAPAATTPARSWPVLALAIAAGLAAGALTLAGQKLLAGSGGWFILVNSASPWLMVAFAVGARAPGRWWTAAVAGAMTQAGLVVGYDATARLSALPVAWSSVLIWVATGVVAGPVSAAFITKQAVALLVSTPRGYAIGPYSSRARVATSSGRATSNPLASTPTPPLGRWSRAQARTRRPRASTRPATSGRGAS